MKDELLKRLGQMSLDLAIIRKSNPLLHIRNKWLGYTFISSPKLVELSAFERMYTEQAQKANLSELQVLKHYQTTLLSGLKKCKPELVNSSLESLLGILTSEQELFKSTSTEDETILAEQTKTPSNYADLLFYTKNLLRIEYALRLNISRLDATLRALTESINAILETDVDSEVLDTLSRHITYMEEVKADMLLSLENYKALTPILKEYIDTNSKRLLEAEKLTFEDALKKLNVKVTELGTIAKTNKEYAKAAAIAECLSTELEASSSAFFTGKISFNDFQTRCKRAVREAEPELKNHRGWAEVFATLAFALTVLISGGTALLASKAITGNWRFFTTRTDSEKSLEEFKTHTVPMFG